MVDVWNSQKLVTADLQSALRLFNQYIHRADGLLPALEATGYSRSARHFTPKQLAFVLMYLGEPYGNEG